MVRMLPVGRTVRGYLTYDMIAYGSRTWIRMHDAWVLWEEYGMVCMLLTRCVVRVFQASANNKVR
jgi:hypothetical protein